MNSLLLDLLAARAGGNNLAVNDLVARLQSSPGADPQQSLRDLLASQLAQSQASPKHEPPVIDAEDIAAHTSAAEEGAQAGEAAMEELRCQVESMFAELRLLRERTDSLAAALGACCLCWGQDAGCRFCHGRGAPGYAMPDESLLAELVLPAIRILQVHRARSGVFSPKPQPHTPEASVPVQGGRLS
jgi:hypothetical protein